MRKRNFNNLRHSGYDVQVSSSRKSTYGILKKIIILIIIIGIIGCGLCICWSDIMKNKDMIAKKKIELKSKYDKIVTILNSENMSSNTIKIETPKELDTLRIDLTVNQTDIALESAEKKKVNEISKINTLINGIFKIEGEFISYDGELYFRGKIQNTRDEFNFPKLTLSVIGYSEDLSKVLTVEHSKYFLSEDTYELSLQSSSSADIIVKISDSNTKSIKIGVKTGDKINHSSANASYISNNNIVPVIPTENYNADSSYLPFRYGIVDEDGNVSKVFENSELIKEYDIVDESISE